VYGNFPLFNPVWAHAKMLFITSGTKGICMGVFQKKKGVWNFALLAQNDQFFLQTE
jgi:hypothetical protein